MTQIIFQAASEDPEANPTASVVNLNLAVIEAEDQRSNMVVNNYNFYHNHPLPRQLPPALIPLSRA